MIAAAGRLSGSFAGLNAAGSNHLCALIVKLNGGLLFEGNEEGQGRGESRQNEKRLLTPRGNRSILCCVA